MYDTVEAWHTHKVNILQIRDMIFLLSFLYLQQQEQLKSTTKRGETIPSSRSRSKI